MERTPGDSSSCLGVRAHMPSSLSVTYAESGIGLVQLYSAMVFEGPGLPRRILKGMEQLMQRDGFASIAEAVGSE